MKNGWYTILLDHWEVLTAIGTAVGMVTLAAIKYVMKHMKGIRCTKTPATYDMAVKVKELLIEIRTETRADRAQVHLFHNGEHFTVNNASIQRFTCYSEALSPGVAPSANNYNRKLISSYIDGIQKIIDAGGKIVKFHNSDIPDCLYKAEMMNTGTSWHLGVALRWKSQIIGYLLLHYNREDWDPAVCAFEALRDEGNIIENDKVSLKVCNGDCLDCRFRYYIPRLESILGDSA